MFDPTPEDFWRGITLYGANQTTYKMALGKLLMKYAKKNIEKLTLDELSEDFFQIYDHYFKKMDSRWNLLEYSFEKISEAERIFVDTLDEKLFVIRKDIRRDLTPIKDALAGYQQDRCFYCGEQLYDPSHVDHVIPFKALGHNEFWNLVVAHEQCNLRKTDNLVGLHFIENLIERNEYVIKSHLPLHKEIQGDLGKTPKIRRQKILDSYLYAKNDKKLNLWEGDSKYDPRNDIFYRGWIKHIGGLQ